MKKIFQVAGNNVPKDLEKGIKSITFASALRERRVTIERVKSKGNKQREAAD